MLYALKNTKLYWYRASLYDAAAPVYVTSVLQADKFWTANQLKQRLATIHRSHRQNFKPAFIWTNIKTDDIKIWLRYHISILQARKTKAKNK